MGNSTSRVVGCFVPKDGVDLEFLEPLDEGLGHSFCYVRPVDSAALTPSDSDRFVVDSGAIDADTGNGSFRRENADDSSSQRPGKSFAETTFKTISGASVSANASAVRTGNAELLVMGDAHEPAASFESTASFASIPLQPVPRGSGPLNGFLSGPLERGFASGPLEKGGGFMSGPLDSDRSNFSAPLGYGPKRASFGHLVRSISRPMRGAFSKTFVKDHSGSSWMRKLFVQPVSQFAKFSASVRRGSSDVETSENEYANCRNLQWAHGKAGEDRVHVVLSEEQGWLFVGIYDGFSGPDAPDFLMKNLYKAIDKELEGLLWDYEQRPVNELDHNDATNLIIGSCSNVEKRHDADESANLREIAVEKQHEQEGCIGESTSIEEVCDAKREAKDAGSDRDDVEENKGTHLRRISSKGGKSMRLFELLQMELMFDLERDDLEDENRMTASSSMMSASEGLCFGESLRSSQPISRSSRTYPGLELDSSELNDGALFPETNGPKLATFASLSASGRKQMMRNSVVIGAKLKAIYRKQKSLRKKLFPWSYDWHRERHQLSIDQRASSPSNVIRRCRSGNVDHDAVLSAMSRALEATEEAYMEMVEKTLDKNPELSLMGSCVLVMLMKDQDVYIMNLGDSRAILAQEKQNNCLNNCACTDDSRLRSRSKGPLVRVELDRISEESPIRNPNNELGGFDKNKAISFYRLKLRALQLSTDHNIDVEEEVLRIRTEHADDPQAVSNERVKGQLKVTRAFGAGFLKKAKFNDALLEMFRIEYVGKAPYLSSTPSIRHHRLCTSDRFLVLSSDGLYQYFSNEEVVSHVAWFMENMPEGDPAQYLIAELLFRAAKKNGMDFHELLDIPQGDRRKYHDDVSVMIISLEGRIWRSCG